MTTPRYGPKLRPLVTGRTAKPAPPEPASSYLQPSITGRPAAQAPPEPPSSYLNPELAGRKMKAPSAAIRAKTDRPYIGGNVV